ncbi:MAG: hypothetical protein KC493_10625 [Bacteriovoracaceae bacterium]|nr:hypothetical protein [Bacteriovoracaceae bacterium]
MEVIKSNKGLSKHLLKLISFFFGITLWFYVLNSEPLEVTKTLELEYILPKGVAISNIHPPDVKVKLKGSRTFMRNLFGGNEKVFVNLKSSGIKGKGSIEHLIGEQDIPAPFGVQVLSIEPKVLELEFQKEVTKRIRVTPNLVGEVSRDLKLINSRMDPIKIKLKGPSKLMKKLKEVSTSPIDLSSLKRSGSLKVNIEDLDQRVKIVGESPVNFNYEVSPRKANITLKNVPVRFLTSARRYSSKQRLVSMDVLVSEGADLNLKNSEVSVVADIPNGSSGTVDVPLRTVLPEGVFLLKIHPESIKVYVKP